MASRITAFILLILFSHFSWGAQELNLVGDWEFKKIIYRGELRDPFNPLLVIKYKFSEDGTNSLIYYRQNENGFCERSAEWSTEPGLSVLHQKVTLVNPANRMDCGQDRDMQLGAESWTHVYIENDMLHLVLPFGEETITFVWERTAETVTRPEQMLLN